VVQRSRRSRFVTWPNHGLAAGSAVQFTTTGALPTGLTAGTTYYVANDANLMANTFAVSNTQAHALAGTNQIATSGSQSGVQTGWNVSTLIGTFAATSLGFVGYPSSMTGALCQLGLIVITAGGAAASMTALLDQFVALRRELRDLQPMERDWFRLTVTATATALRERRTSTIATNIPPILDCCKRLAAHLGASIEIIERDDGLTDLIFRPPSRRRLASQRH
jgi:hypothetical protein